MGRFGSCSGPLQAEAGHGTTLGSDCKAIQSIGFSAAASPFCSPEKILMLRRDLRLRHTWIDLPMKMRKSPCWRK